MKYSDTVATLVVLALILISACSDSSSPTSLNRRTNLLTRSWSGEEFFTLNANGSPFRAGDIVTELRFNADGTLFLSTVSMSSLGKTGRWNFESFGTSIRLTFSGGSDEVFFIQALSDSTLVLGDTTSRGFALVPFQH